MKINKKIKDSFNKMVMLEIPREKRRQYIETCFDCMGRIYGLPKMLNDKLGDLYKRRVNQEEASLEIQQMIKHMKSDIGRFYNGTAEGYIHPPIKY
jgi:hypothetical protein